MEAPVRILLAEPRAAAGRTLERSLLAAGFEVEHVTTGREVILQCDIAPPHVLIMELNLPDMDGFDVCEYVREETRGLDLTIIITAQPNDDMTRAYLGPMVDFAGGDYFLVKPFDSHLLIQLIEDVACDAVASPPPDGPGFPTRVVWPTHRAPMSTIDE